MPNFFLDQSQLPRYGNMPCGNLSLLAITLKTNAAGAALNAGNPPAPLLINDKVYLGTLPAGFVVTGITTLVTVGMTASVVGDLGIEYVDGVASTVLPATANLLGANLALATVARLADVTTREPIALPKDAHLVLLIKGANNVKASNVSFLVAGEAR